MKYLRNFLLVFAIAVIPIQTRAWFNPQNTMALMKILANSIKQLMEMRRIVRSAQDELRLLRDINQGIHQALNAAIANYPEGILTIYKEWDDPDEALKMLQEMYGIVEDSKDRTVLEHLDKTIAEVVLLQNKTLKQSKDIHKIGGKISRQAVYASPKGAQKLNAQGMGVLLQVQNRSLETQSAGLKLQAQHIANQNRKEKEAINFFMKSSRQLRNAMKGKKIEFKTLRF